MAATLWKWNMLWAQPQQLVLCTLEQELRLHQALNMPRISTKLTPRPLYLNNNGIPTEQLQLPIKIMQELIKSAS